MQTVTETPLFAKQAEKLLNDIEKAELVNFLAWNPTCGDVIPGTGGIRKVRIALEGRGKRGGARVIFFFFNEFAPLYALAVYAKNVKTDLTPEEKKAVSKFTREIKDVARRKT